VHHDRRARVHPDAAVRGRRDHRDRGDGNDLPVVLRRQHRIAPRAPARLAEGEGAVLTRPLGPPGQPARARLGRRDADQLRVAAHPDEPDPGSDRSRPGLPLELAEPPSRALDRGRRAHARRVRVLPARATAQPGASRGARRRDVRRRIAARGSNVVSSR
jgi:hypothetical protein